jgi:hypothetical protein
LEDDGGWEEIMTANDQVPHPDAGKQRSRWLTGGTLLFVPLLAAILLAPALYWPPEGQASVPLVSLRALGLAAAPTPATPAAHADPVEEVIDRLDVWEDTAKKLSPQKPKAPAGRRRP